MNRIEFIGQTHQGTMMSLDDIVKYFDHAMAAYEVVERVDGLSVNGVPDNSYNSLKIKVASPHQSELDDVVSYINDTLHNQKITYDKSFSITAVRDGDLVELSVCENKK